MFPQNTPQPPMGNMPQGMPDPSGSQPVPPEQAKELQDLADILHQKLERMKALRFSSDAYLEKFRGKLLAELFKRMQDSGVNLQDPQSVNAFLKKMSDISPDLGQEFEQLLGLLMGEDVPAGGEEQDSGGEPMPEEGAGAPGMPPQGMPPMPGMPPQTPGQFPGM